MFKILAKTETVAEIIAAVSVMDKEGNLTFKPDGIHALVVSFDHTALVTLFYPKEMFESYVVESDTEFGFIFDEFKKKLARCGDKVTLSHTNTFNLISDYRHYTVPVKTVKPVGKEPMVNFTSKITLEREEFKKFLDDVEPVAPKIKITTDNTKVVFFGQGELSEDTVTLTPELANVEGVGEAFYDVSYLQKMANAVKADTIQLRYANELPLNVTLGNVNYYLGSWKRQGQ